MKKIIVFVTVIVILGSGTSFAQGNSASDSVFAAKNSIGINLAPALVSLLGGSNMYPRIGIRYKREVKQGTLRFGFSYSGGTVSAGAQPYYTAVINDSTRRDYYNYYELNEKYQLDMGFEHVFGKKKLKQFFGADLISGFYHSHFYNFTRDIWTGNVQPPTPSTGTNQYVIGTTDLGTVFNKTFFLGISPFYGVSYPLSRHFLVTAQVGYDFALGWTTGEKKVYSGTASTQHSTNFDINTPGIINDVSLVYRF